MEDFITILAFALVISLIGALTVLSLWGLVIAFTSHVITGIIALVVQPLPTIIGVFDGIFQAGIAEAITNFLLSL